MQLYGTISYLPTTVHTEKELIDLKKYNLTPESPEWNPHTEVYGNQEHSMLNFQGQLVNKQPKDRTIFGVEGEHNDGISVLEYDVTISEVLTSISSNYCPRSFAYNISNISYDVASVWSGR